MKKYLYVVALLFVCAFLMSCSRQELKHKPYTKDTVQPILLDLQWKLMANESKVGTFPYYGDSTYVIVNHKWLFEFYPKWKNELHKQGVVTWDTKFDCNKFASSFVSYAQIEYFKYSFGTTRPQSLALAEIWFQQDNDTKHAIVAALTDIGLIFIEPQTGERVYLTKEQHASIFLKKF